MYNLLVIGNPVSLMQDGVTLGEVVLGPSVVAASVAARLGIHEMILLGNVPVDWREGLIADFEKYAIPEHYLVGHQSHSKAITVPDTKGRPVRVAVSDERISMRDFPEEFLSSKVILIAPFGEEVDAELIEWLSSSSSGKLVWDPGLFRIRQDEAIPLSLERQELVRILKSVDIVSINVRESQLLVDESDPEVAAELLVAWGADTSIVTDGKNGSTIYDGKDFIHVSAYPIDDGWKCWTGAAFIAGLSCGLIRDANIIESTALASSAASVFVESNDRFAPLSKELVRARQESILQKIVYK